MSHLQTYQEEDDERFDREVDEYNQTLQESMNLSLKDHLDRLESMVKGMLTDLETSKRTIVTVKKDFLEFDAHYHNTNMNFGGMIEKRMKLLAEDFERLIRESRSDMAFLRQQLDKTLEDADTLEQLADQLEQKIYKNEEFIGFGHGPDQTTEQDQQNPDNDDQFETTH